MRFIADKSFVDALRQEPDIKVESEETKKDATRLGFDLETAAAIVTIIQGALYMGELAVKILNARAESQSNKIILQTPFATVELIKDAQITADELREILKAAQKVSR